MRFRKTESRDSETTSYSDALVDLIVARASGDIAKASATAALQTVAGLVSRAFAAAEIEGPPVIASALDGRTRAMIGRALIRSGECLFLPTFEDGMTLRPASAWTVTGGYDAQHWQYLVHLAGPSLQTSRHYPASDVLHFMGDRDPARPWRGISPLQSAALAGRLSAELVAALGDEATGVRGVLLPVPADGKDASVAQLKQDLGSMKGKTALVEDQRSAGIGAPGERVGNSAGWQPVRLGADPPTALVELAAWATAEVQQACGVNPGLFSNSGTVSREAWRQFLHSLAAPLGALVAEEISEKTGQEVRFTWAELRASDIMSKARALGSMVTAGASLESAAMAAGLSGLEAAPEPEPTTAPLSAGSSQSPPTRPGPSGAGPTRPGTSGP